jgi:hypothetical protein
MAKAKKQKSKTKPQLEASRLNLWSTPIFLVKNPQHEVIKQGLVDHILCQEKKQKEAIQSKQATSIKTNLSESDFLFLQNSDDPYVQALTSFIVDSASQVITDVNKNSWKKKYTSDNPKEPALQIRESWYHVTRYAGAHSAHFHPNCSWCAIYYIDVGDLEEGEYAELHANGRLVPKAKGGVNAFYRPWIMGYNDIAQQYTAGVFRPQPEDGLLIIFPSYLSHNAESYLGTEKERIVVALNMAVNLEERNNG